MYIHIYIEGARCLAQLGHCGAFLEIRSLENTQKLGRQTPKRRNLKAPVGHQRNLKIAAHAHLRNNKIFMGSEQRGQTSSNLISNTCQLQQDACRAQTDLGI